MTLNEFTKLWSHHKGVMYVCDIDNYDPIDDTLSEGICNSTDIFNKIGESPYFAIWMEDTKYSPAGYLQKEYYNADVLNFFIVDNGLIILIDYEQVRELRNKLNESDKLQKIEARLREWEFTRANMCDADFECIGDIKLILRGESEDTIHNHNN